VAVVTETGNRVLSKFEKRLEIWVAAGAAGIWCEWTNGQTQRL